MVERKISEIRVWSLKLSVLGLAVFLPFSDLIHSLSYRLQLIPFMLSMVFLGLPHGAIDHLIPSKLSNISLKKSITDISLLYLIIGLIYGLWWFLEPISALIFFIIMTWLHWGQGDLYAILTAENLHLNRKPDKLLSLLVRGGIPMLVPLIFYPDQYQRFISSIIELFALQTDILAPLFSRSISLTTFGLIGGLTAASFLLGLYRVSNGRPVKTWIYDQLEIAFLWIYFMLLPPIFAVGLYFCLWHSLRHLTRISLIKNTELSNKLLAGKDKAFVKELVKEAAPMTVLALTFISALVFIVPKNVLGAESMISVYLVGISILTLPHFIIVSWMDCRQEVWMN